MNTKNISLSQIAALEGRLSDENFRSRALYHFPIAYPALMKELKRYLFDTDDWTQEEKNTLFNECQNLLLSVSHLESGPSPV